MEQRLQQQEQSLSEEQLQVHKLSVFLLVQQLLVLPPELGTRYFKSNDDIGTDTLQKSTVGTDNGTFLKR